MECRDYDVFWFYVSLEGAYNSLGHWVSEGSKESQENSNVLAAAS